MLRTPLPPARARRRTAPPARRAAIGVRCPRGDFQPQSRPARTSRTDQVWRTIIRGAISAERASSAPKALRTIRSRAGLMRRRSIGGEPGKLRYHQEGKDQREGQGAFDGGRAGCHQKHQPEPQRRCKIGEYARNHMDPACRMQPRRADDQEMLEVALTPAPVAAMKGLECLRPVLGAAARARIHHHGPAGATDPCRLDDVVAQDAAAKRGLAAQLRQAGRFAERPRPDQRIVTPVIACLAGPGRETAHEGRTDEPPGDPLEPAEARLGRHERDPGLQEAYPGPGLDVMDHAPDAVRAHATVGIENEHVVEIRTCPVEPVRDVSGFPSGIRKPSAVSHDACRDERRHHGLFHGDRLRPGRVGQHEDLAGLAQTFTAEGPCKICKMHRERQWRFTAKRDENCGSPLWTPANRWRKRDLRRHEQADERGRRTAGDPDNAGSDQNQCDQRRQRAGLECEGEGRDDGDREYGRQPAKHLAGIRPHGLRQGGQA